MGPIFHEKMVLGAKFYGILVPWWDQKLQARTIFPWNIGAGEQNSMEYLSPGPIFSGTNFPVTVPLMEFTSMLKYGNKS